MSEQVQITDFEHVEVHTDAGGHGLKWVCPDCNETVIWAPFAWWQIECSCRDWDINIIGTVKE